MAMDSIAGLQHSEPTQAIYYSPSDGTEGPVLRDFVDETLAHEQPSQPPPSELLSTVHPSSGATIPFSSQDAVSQQRDFRPRRGPTQRYRRERESVYRNTDHHEILRLLIEHEYEASKMRKTLYLAFAEIENQTQRTAAAERQSQETTAQLQRINQSRLAAERESHALEEELTLYKIQYDLAQKEILKARDTLARLEAQLNDAESAARKARGDARKVKEAMGIWRAREEGRKQGFEDGWRRAREEFGIISGQPVLGYEGDGGVVPPPAALSVQRSETQVEDDDLSEHNASPRRHEQPIQLPEVPLVPRYDVPPSLPNPHPVTAPPPVNPPPPNQPPDISTFLQPEPIVQPEPGPSLDNVPPPRAPSRSTVGIRTPAIQTYALEIPPPDQVEFDNRPPRSNSRKRAPPQPWRPEEPMQQRRSPSPHPPINYIPSLSDEGRISLPPPHEIAEYPSSPQPDSNELPPTNFLSRGLSLDGGGRRDVPTVGKGKGKAIQSWYNRGRAHDPPAPGGNGSNMDNSAELQPSSWYQPKQSKGSSPVRSKDYAYENPARDRRSSFNSGHSRNSGSVSTHYSKMDLLNAPWEAGPSDNKRSSGIGSTIKNIFRKGKGRELSMIKESSLSRQASLNVASQPPQQPFEGVLNPGPPYAPPTAMDVNQRFADSLRYENPAEVEQVEEWRAEHHPGPIPTRDRPPRNVRVPAELTVPAPLSPQRHPQGINAGHSRSMSMGSMSSGFYQGPPPHPISSPRSSAGRQSMAGRNAGDRNSRRVVSMSGNSNNNLGSPPVVISVQPPSQSPSETPAGLNSATRQGMPIGPSYSSPRYNGAALPHDHPRSPSVRPVVPPSSAPYGDGWVPTEPNTPRASETSVVWPSTERPPSRIAGGSIDPNGSTLSNYPVVGQHERVATPSSLHRTPDYPTSHTRTPSRAAQRPLPTSRPASAASSRPSHRPSHSAHLPGGGETLGVMDRPLPDSSAHLRSSSIDRPLSLKRVPSNLSVRSGGSYSHFDPDTYRDPAFFAADTAN